MVMPDLLKITSNVEYLLLVSFAFYCLFCYLFVYSLPGSRSRLTDIDWKRVDYAWLAAAIAGLVLQSGQVRSEWAALEHKGYELNLSMAKFDVKRFARDLSDGYFCTASSSNDRSSNGNEATKDEFARACAQFNVFKIKDASEDLYQDKEFAHAAFTIDEVLPLYDNSEIRIRLNRLKNSYMRYSNLEDGYNASLRKTKLSEYEMMLRWVSPLLLAVALALRFAKVTGEIRLKTHQLDKDLKPCKFSKDVPTSVQPDESPAEDKKKPPEGGQEAVTEKPTA